MDKMKWIIFTVVVVAIFTGIVLVSKSNDPPFEGDPNKVVTDGPIPDRVYADNTEGKVLLIEYGDFQCPGCRSMEPAVQELRDQYKGKLTFVFRNFPLTNIHGNALAASTAAEAAGQQGKFFLMHDLLYSRQDEWQAVAVNQRSSTFEGYAAMLGMDVEKFKQDMNSKDVSTKIGRDRSIGRKVGVESTPTFVLDGQRLPESTATDAQKLKEAVAEAVKKAYPDAAAQQPVQ